MGVDRRAIGGPSARVLANGREVGWAERVSGSVRITNRKVKVLSNIRGEEHVPVDFDVDFTCEMVRIRDLSVVGMNVWPRGTTVEIMNFPKLVFEIVDDNGNTIERISECTPRQRGFNIDAGGLFMENVGWDALDSEPILGNSA